MGFIYKTLFMLEAGIKPIWIFDGVPPDQKKHELAKRKLAKMKAKVAEDEVKDLGNVEDQRKFAVRGIKVTSTMTEDSIRILELMGVPVFKAKSEAEAQCVDLLKKKKVAAVVSDDMDCLTFGSKVLLKGVKSKNDPIFEINLDDVLKETELEMNEFIDFCILCGCDYLPTIHGLGPVTAYKYIQKYKCLEKVIEAIEEENKESLKTSDKVKFQLPNPDDYDFVTARELFKNPDVADLDMEVSLLVQGKTA